MRRLIGAGGHGSVYVALENMTGRQLACKILSIDEHLRRDLQDLSRFRSAEMHALSDKASVQGNEALQRYSQAIVARRLNKLEREYDVLDGLSHASRN